MGDGIDRRSSAAIENRAGPAARSSSKASMTATDPTPTPPSNAPPIMCQALGAVSVEQASKSEAAVRSTAIIMAIGCLQFLL
jgi:hypothetical protein